MSVELQEGEVIAIEELVNVEGEVEKEEEVEEGEGEEEGEPPGKRPRSVSLALMDLWEQLTAHHVTGYTC